MPPIPMLASLFQLNPSGLIGASLPQQLSLPSPPTGMPPPCSTSKPLRQPSGINAAVAAAALMQGQGGVDDQVVPQPSGRQESQQPLQGPPQPGVSAARPGPPGE
jgi:hypothetical protein